MKGLKYFVLAVFLFLPVNSFATFIDNNTNLSVEWVRMQARTGSFDSIDAISYNPAGTVQKDDGLYMSIQNQVLPKSYAHKYKDIEHKATNTTNILPGLFTLHKKGNWSQFGGVNVIGGGGTLIYDNSIFNKTPMGPINLTPNYKSSYSSAYISLMAGAAYKINDKLSFSFAGRALKGTSALEIEKGKILKVEKSAIGFSPVIGANYKHSDKLNIGFRHEFKTEMDFEVDTLSGLMAPKFGAAQGIKKGSKSRKDFPALTTLGAAYMLTPKLKIAADFLYCWHEDVEWEGTAKADNGFEASLGLEYQLIETFKVSAGYSYQDSKLDKDDYSTVLGKNPYNVVSTGFAYSPSDKSTINFGVSKFFYRTQKDSMDIDYIKDLWIFGLSLEYKFW